VPRRATGLATIAVCLVAVALGTPLVAALGALGAVLVAMWLAMTDGR
jgi:hypothetical protein